MCPSSDSLRERSELIKLLRNGIRAEIALKRMESQRNSNPAALPSPFAQLYFNARRVEVCQGLNNALSNVNAGTESVMSIVRDIADLLKSAPGRAVTYARESVTRSTPGTGPKSSVEDRIPSQAVEQTHKESADKEDALYATDYSTEDETMNQGMTDAS